MEYGNLPSEVVLTKAFRHRTDDIVFVISGLIRLLENESNLLDPLLELIYSLLQPGAEQGSKFLPADLLNSLYMEVGFASSRENEKLVLDPVVALTVASILLRFPTFEITSERLAFSVRFIRYLRAIGAEDAGGMGQVIIVLNDIGTFVE